jgi:hypothetical protein
MSITRAKTSSVAQGPSTKKTLLGGNDVILGGSYDAIGTVTVGSGGQATITFSSIPQTYKHLQLRAFVRTNRTPSVTDPMDITLNSNNSSVYAWHALVGSGSSAVAASATSQSLAYISAMGSGSVGNFGATIVDFLDYSNTSKNKTIRALSGSDSNGGGAIYLESNLFQSTTGITRIDLVSQSASTFLQYSQFDLYGIK